MTFVFQVSCSECLLFLKDFVTWQVCEMLSDISPGGVFYVAFCNYHVGAPCRTIKIVIMACGSLTFSLWCLKRKAPMELVAM